MRIVQDVRIVEPGDEAAAAIVKVLQATAETMQLTYRTPCISFYGAPEQCTAAKQILEQKLRYDCFPLCNAEEPALRHDHTIPC